MNKLQKALNRTWAKEALDLVRQQKAPASWQVFQGKKTSLPGLPTVYLATGLILILCPWPALIALIVLKGGYSEGRAPHQIHHRPIWPDLNVPLYCLVSVAIIVGLVLAVRLIGKSGAAKRDRNQLQPMLIVLPGGWVEYVGWRDLIFGMAFAELADLQRGTAPSQRITTLADLQKKAPLTESDKWLALTFPDGEKETWGPRMNCDSPEAACQAILVAYSQYLARSVDHNRPL
ncbi:MAG TPA: hypothetical protein VF458_22870 [Ktedonobacteraceae bacterium]